MTRLVSMIAICLFAASMTLADDLSGDYDAEGTGPSGAPYKADVTISKKGELYAVTWKISAIESYTGVGILKDKILSVGWGDGKVAGVILFTIEDKKLVGTWAVLGGEKTYTETLVRK